MGSLLEAVLANIFMIYIESEIFSANIISYLVCCCIFGCVLLSLHITAIKSGLLLSTAITSFHGRKSNMEVKFFANVYLL